jgi:hypothetical protein
MCVWNSDSRETAEADNIIGLLCVPKTQREHNSLESMKNPQSWA